MPPFIPGPQTATRRIVAWEDPPARDTTSVRHIYDDIAESLQANPGAWARLEDRQSANAAQQFSSNVNNGKIAGLAPAGAFEATYRGTSVYVRSVAMDLSAIERNARRVAA